MSVFSKDTIQLYADSIGITQLPEDVSNLLCADMEYRVREIIQEASKFMRHSKRSKLTVEDVNNALKAKHAPPLLGYDPALPLSFKHYPQGNIYYTWEQEIDFDTLLNAPLPKVPASVSFTSHWLAIEGVQPAIPENPVPAETGAEGPSDDLAAALQSATAGLKAGSTATPSAGTTSGPILQDDPSVPGGKVVVKHHLSKEHQMYFETVTNCLLSKDPATIMAALTSLRSDAGIQQLLPYFVQFLAEMSVRYLKNLDMLRLLMRMMEALLTNQHLFLEPYLHQLMPTLLTCILGKRLGTDPGEDHWVLRQEAARLVSLICKRYGDAYATLQPRVMKTLLKALFDADKEGDAQPAVEKGGAVAPLPAKYGALWTLAALGVDTVRLFILPRVAALLHTFETLGTAPEQARCRAALLKCLVEYLREELRSDPALLAHDLPSRYPDIFEAFGEELSAALGLNMDAMQL